MGFSSSLLNQSLWLLGCPTSQKKCCKKLFIAHDGEMNRTFTFTVQFLECSAHLSWGCFLCKDTIIPASNFWWYLTLGCCGCFGTTSAELSRYSRDCVACKAENIFYLVLFFFFPHVLLTLEEDPIYPEHLDYSCVIIKCKIKSHQTFYSGANCLMCCKLFSLATTWLYFTFLLQNPKDWLAKPWVDRASTFTRLGNILISN